MTAEKRAKPHDWRTAEEIIRDRLKPQTVRDYNLRVRLAVSAIIYSAIQKQSL